MSDWSVGGEKWVKTGLRSGQALVFRVSDVRYALSDGDDCEIHMNDGKVFDVKFSAEDFYNLL